MYTVCPGCTRQFEIHAEHLAAAGGQVRCGFCHEQFNATERLHDKPLSNEKILKDQLDSDSEFPAMPMSAIEQEVEIEPQLERPEETEEKIAAFDNEADTDDELETAIGEIGIRPSAEEIKIKLKNEAFEFNESEPEIELTLEREIELEQEMESEAEEESVLNHYDFPEPEVLLEEKPVKRGGAWIPIFFWTASSLFALLILFSQLAWFNRDRLLLEYPELKPYAKQFCVELDCKLTRERDTRAIKLINRDVRLHPGYQDTLLVNAAMKNELSVRQPYPRVQLTLFDTSGSLLGYREFVPDDYLDDSIDIDEGMPIDSPVYFVLEVSGPTAGAVSFEFRFL